MNSSQSFVPKRGIEGELLGDRFVVFDGACGFCTFAILQAIRADAAGRYVFVPHQYLEPEDLSRFSLTVKQCSSAVHVVDDRKTYEGAYAVNRYLWNLPMMKPLVVGIYASPLLLFAEMLLYRLVANQRSVISRALGTRRYAAISESGAGLPFADRMISKD